MGYLYKRGQGGKKVDESEEGIWYLQYTIDGKTRNVSLKTDNRKQAEKKRKAFILTETSAKNDRRKISTDILSPCDIRQGDCLELMKAIPDKSIDMVLCDLPSKSTSCAWDKIIPLDKLWEQYKRIIKNNGAIVLTASQPFAAMLIESNRKLFRHEWIWEKSKASNFVLAKIQPLKAHETVLVFGKGKVNYFPQKTQGEPYYRGTIEDRHDNPEVSNNIQNYHSHVRKSEDGMRLPRSVQYFGTAENDGKFHPTQKPLKLFEYLIKTYTQEGELVLDNCAGGFTTAAACDNTKRKWICMEKEPDFCSIGRKRINDNRIEIYKAKIKIMQNAIDSIVTG